MKKEITAKQFSFTTISILFTMLFTLTSWAQQQTGAVVPHLVRFGGVLTDLSGKPLTGTVGVTFSLFTDQQGGAPLWLETQNVVADRTGHYSVHLGSTKPDGIPTDLFTSGEARWLGVQPEGQAEQPRVLLLSVPYALKAGDSETLGGLPASAFVLAAPPSTVVNNAEATSTSASNSRSGPPATNVTGAGTLDFIPMWTSTSNIGNSVLFQSGSGSTAKVGINTTTPGATLDVKGTANVEGLLTLPATGAATSTAGKNSQSEDFVASSYNSGTAGAVKQTFQWQAEPTGNNTSTPSATLNLLFGSGTTAPAETGLKLNSKGLITFATGQAFPGTGTGTVKSVGLTAPSTDFTVSGSPVTGSGTLNFAWNVAPTNANTANAIVKRDASGNFNAGTITAKSFSGNGASITNVNASQFGGLAPNAYAQLAASNTFTTLQTITSSSNADGLDVSATGTGNGILSFAASGDAVAGFETANTGTSPGVIGITLSPSAPGVAGTGGTGVQGQSTICCSGPGGNFAGFSAASGSSLSGTDGVDAFGGNGDPSNPSQGGAGVRGTGGSGMPNIIGIGGDGPGGYFQGGSGTFNGDGIDAFAGSGFGGRIKGDFLVTGTISAGTKDFKIDHPLDPGNKYLVHASVESSEMMNIYTGNVTTDAQGQATVQLPEWFEVLNTDFRYQLTVIGQFAQAIVADEIRDHQFSIRTNAPNVKVSWQVTGVRQDAFAKAHPLVVEEKKDARLQGFYIHPELYGAPEEKQIEWARHPEMMKRMKEQRVPAPPAIKTVVRAKIR
jgi:hypothetical protein